ncbi:MAG TPA: darcynin family protein [Burkholderiaceae bacterium]|nr:darcynin family protein [Burkholderiaceae bacterium]
MPRCYTFFMLLQSTSRWRTLSVDEQHAHHDALLMQVFEGYPELKLRHFDSTAFAGRCSDVLLWETTDVAQYYHAVEWLRDRGPLGAQWFEVVDVIPAVEDAWREHDACSPIEASVF